MKVNRSLWDSTTVSKAMDRTSHEHDQAADDNNNIILLGYDFAIDNDDDADGAADEDKDEGEHYLLML